MLKIPPKLVELVANVHGEPLSESIKNSLSSEILTDALKIATISWIEKETLKVHWCRIMQNLTISSPSYENNMLKISH